MVNVRRSHRLPLLLLLAAGLATGAACGGSGSGSDNGVASIKNVSDKSSDAGSDGQAKDGKDKKNPEDAMLEFARCMREHGVDMPDPDTSGGPGVVTFRAGGASSGAKAIDIDGDTFQKANEACKDLMGDVGPMNMTPEQQQEMQDQALAFSRCMREHGVNMPDPTFGEKGQMMMKIGDGDGIDPSDPKFQDAQQACGSAFGPAGAKAGAGLSVAGGKADGPKGGGKGGMIMVSPGASVAGGGAK
ncbi:MAG TPA: hypothetical protein VJ653_07220 [Acidimicrobiales bacterium]|nr:hypothetical protein [Acidimicrobiales bacterium]